MIVPTSNSWCRARFPPYHLGYQTWLNKNSTITTPEWYIKGPASSNVQKQPNHCIVCHSILQPTKAHNDERGTQLHECRKQLRATLTPCTQEACSIRKGGRCLPLSASIVQEPAWMSLTCLKVLEWFYMILTVSIPQKHSKLLSDWCFTCYSNQSCPCLLRRNLLPISLSHCLKRSGLKPC